MTRRPWIDHLRDGALPADLADGYDLGVARVLGTSALGARNSGYSQPMWEAEVLDPRSRLGTQVRLDKRSKPRTERAVQRLLTKAWERAERQYAKSPRWTQSEARSEAQKRAVLVRKLADDANLPLTHAQRVLLLHLADKAKVQGSTVVNAPREATRQATGLGERAVRYGLDRLVEVGLLVLVERGRPRGKGSAKPARANAYRLPGVRATTEYLRRETVQVEPAISTVQWSSHLDREEKPELVSITLTQEQIVRALGESALIRLLEAAGQHEEADIRHLRTVGKAEGSPN